MESRFHEDCFSIDCGFRRVQGDDWFGCLRVGILPTEQMHKTEPQWLRKFMVHFCAREKNRLNKPIAANPIDSLRLQEITFQHDNLHSMKQGGRSSSDQSETLCGVYRRSRLEVRPNARAGNITAKGTKAGLCGAPHNPAPGFLTSRREKRSNVRASPASRAVSATRCRSWCANHSDRRSAPRWAPELDRRC